MYGAMPPLSEQSQAPQGPQPKGPTKERRCRDARTLAAEPACRAGPRPEKAGSLWRLISSILSTLADTSRLSIVVRTISRSSRTLSLNRTALAVTACSRGGLPSRLQGGATAGNAALPLRDLWLGRAFWYVWYVWCGTSQRSQSDQNI